MGKYFLLIVCSAMILSGCATVSEKIEPVPAPVPQRNSQRRSNRRLSPRPGKTYKRKIAIGRFTNETVYGRSLLTDAEFDRIGKQASDILGSRLIKSGNSLYSNGLT